MNMTNRRGFTLVELLVVVLIIGILSSVALPQYTKAVEKSRSSEPLTVFGSLRPAVDLWVLENGYYYVELVGQSSASGSRADRLDVDVERMFHCTGDRCESHNFSYDVYCSDDACYMNASRINSSYNYNIRSEKRKSTGAWSTWCDGDSKICNSINSTLSGAR